MTPICSPVVKQEMLTSIACRISESELLEWGVVRAFGCVIWGLSWGVRPVTSLNPKTLKSLSCSTET